MADRPDNHGEKRAVVDEEWTPRFVDVDQMEAFEQEMDDISDKIPQVEPAQKERQ